VGALALPTDHSKHDACYGLDISRSRSTHSRLCAAYVLQFFPRYRSHPADIFSPSRPKGLSIVSLCSGPATTGNERIKELAPGE
jgi:hypothetical protein